MWNTKLADAFNKQINEELQSSYLYLSMAAYFELNALSGMAQWMRAQAKEELEHAMKFYGFINQRSGAVQLGALAAPKNDWPSAETAFQEAYAHEQYITSRIHNLVDMATAEKDHASTAFLQWFVTEQVEEEASVSEIVDRIKMVGEYPGAVLMLDRELGQRS